jgi:hypothetical protein
MPCQNHGADHRRDQDQPRRAPEEQTVQRRCQRRGEQEQRKSQQRRHEQAIAKPIVLAEAVPGALAGAERRDPQHHQQETPRVAALLAQSRDETGEQAAGKHGHADKKKQRRSCVATGVREPAGQPDTHGAE